MKSKSHLKIYCPRCQKPLERTGPFVNCLKCLEKYQSKGYLDLLKKTSYYWGEIPPERMQQVNTESKRVGWKAAVKKLILEYPKMEEYLLNHGRVDWISHCYDLTHKQTCLDIGSGWGSLAFDLSHYYENVYSLEAVKERVEFQAIRKKEEKVNNVHVIRYDFMKLPFPDNSFDLVVVNGVLEWVGISSYKDHPQDMQKAFLREVHRVLKPSGCAYIGIENRFGLTYLFGAEDHSGLPYTSLLPRFIANLVVRYLRRTKGRYKLNTRMEEEWKSYRTYTYSVWGYHGLFKDVGFKKIRSYWTLFYSVPKFSGPMYGGNFKFFLGYLINNSSHSVGGVGKKLAIIGRWLPISFINLLVKLLTPSFLFFVYKRGGRGKISEDSLLAEGGYADSFLKVGGSGGYLAKINYFLLNQGEVEAVIKIARFPQGTAALEREESLLQKFNQVRVDKKMVRGVTFFREGVLKGNHLAPLSKASSVKAFNWLIHFQNRSKSPLNTSRQKEEIAKLKKFIKTLPLSNKIMLKLTRQLELFEKMIINSGLPQVSEHGDYCANNILLDTKGMVKVLDWEDYQKEGNPCFDFLFFVLHGSNKVGENIVINLLGKGRYSNIFNHLSDMFCSYYFIDRKILLNAIPYVVTRLINRSVIDGRHLIDRSNNIELLRKLFLSGVI